MGMMRRIASFDLALIVILWLAITALINPFGDFATNDDWVYGLSVEATMRNGGGFLLPSPAYANVFLQTYWGALFCLPFGFSYTALRFSTLTAALLGITFTYLTARELGLSRKAVLLLTLSLELNPFYVELAHGFMTDVPFIALTAASFWAFVRSVRRGDNRYLQLAFALALASILIRQIGLIFVIAYGLALVIRDRWNIKAIARLAFVTMAGLALHLGFQHWAVATHRISRLVSATDTLQGLEAGLIDSLVYKPFELLPYFGILLLPIYLFTGFSTVRPLMLRHKRSWAIAMVAIVCAQIATWRITHIRLPLFGNIINLWGLGPLTLSDTYFLQINFPATPPIADPIWLGIFLVGIVFGALLSVEVGTEIFYLLRRLWYRQISSGTLVADTALIIAFGFAAFILMMSIWSGIIDRYILTMLSPLAFWIVSRAEKEPASRLRAGAAAVLLAVFGVFATIGTHDYSAWQRARLAATTALDKAGVPHDKVDGGYEYNGRYLYRPDYVKRHGVSRWWVVDDLYQIGSGPVPGYRIVAHFPYRRWLTASSSEVVILRRMQ